MTKYKIIIYWSEEDQAFVAEVPELPGCAAHGSTQEAALANVNAAVGLWIDTANEFGDPTFGAIRVSNCDRRNDASMPATVPAPASCPPSRNT